jgi:IS1 family transposase
LKHLHPADVEVERCRADEVAQRRGLTSELDERWRDVGKNAEPRWLWQAIAHQRGTVLAYVVGRRQDAVLLPRQALVEPCGITRFDPEGWGAYECPLDPEPHDVGTQQTQTIASQHINVRTRMTRVVPRTAINRIAALLASAFGKAGTSYGFFRQMALRAGRGWPCSSYAVLTST